MKRVRNSLVNLPKGKGVPETLQLDNLAPQSSTWSKIFKGLEKLIIMM